MNEVSQAEGTRLCWQAMLHGNKMGEQHQGTVLSQEPRAS